MLQLPSLTSKLRPCLIREYHQDDLAACVDIYRANMPGSLPVDHLPHFEEFLQNGTSYLLVIEDEGRVVGVGGLTLQGGSSNAGLSYGLIHPDCQRQGLGSSLLATRLSLVDPEEWPAKVVLEASPLAGDFYAQFGFELFHTHKGYELQRDENGAATRVPYGHWQVILSQEDVAALQTALAENSVELQLNELPGSDIDELGEEVTEQP